VTLGIDRELGTSSLLAVRSIDTNTAGREGCGWHSQEQVHNNSKHLVIANDASDTQPRLPGEQEQLCTAKMSDGNETPLSAFRRQKNVTVTALKRTELCVYSSSGVKLCTPCV
jgi:hypothetical protein